MRMLRLMCDNMADLVSFTENLFTYFEVAFHFVRVLVAAPTVHVGVPAIHERDSRFDGSRINQYKGPQCDLTGVYIGTTVNTRQVDDKNK